MFDDAQRLLEDMDFESEQEKTENISQVKAVQAHHLFSVEGKYGEGIAILCAINASPVDVVNLFPEWAMDEDQIETDTGNMQLTSNLEFK